MDIPLEIFVIIVLALCIAVVLNENRKLRNTLKRSYRVLEESTWRLASLTRMIMATGDDSMIDIANQILTAQKEEGRIPEHKENGGN